MVRRRLRRRRAGPWYSSVFTKATSFYLMGIGGLAYETFGTNADRPYLLAVFGGMLGLPSFLGRDERRRGRYDHREDEDDYF